MDDRMTSHDRSHDAVPIALSWPALLACKAVEETAHLSHMGLKFKEPSSLLRDQAPPSQEIGRGGVR